MQNSRRPIAELRAPPDHHHALWVAMRRCSMTHTLSAARAPGANRTDGLADAGGLIPRVAGGDGGRRGGKSMKSILDPTFRYVPSVDTDLRKTFARVRREMRGGAGKERNSVEASSAPNVLPIQRRSGAPLQR
jgi:hypothetical protein